MWHSQKAGPSPASFATGYQLRFLAGDHFKDLTQLAMTTARLRSREDEGLRLGCEVRAARRLDCRSVSRGTLSSPTPPGHGSSIWQSRRPATASRPSAACSCPAILISSRSSVLASDRTVTDERRLGTPLPGLMRTQGRRQPQLPPRTGSRPGWSFAVSPMVGAVRHGLGIALPQLSRAHESDLGTRWTAKGKPARSTLTKPPLLAPTNDTGQRLRRHRGLVARSFSQLG